MYADESLLLREANNPTKVISALNVLVEKVLKIRKKQNTV